MPIPAGRMPPSTAAGMAAATLSLSVRSCFLNLLRPPAPARLPFVFAPDRLRLHEAFPLPMCARSRDRLRCDDLSARREIRVSGGNSIAGAAGAAGSAGDDGWQ